MYILLLIQKWLLIDFTVYDFRMNFQRSWEGAGISEGALIQQAPGSTLPGAPAHTPPPQDSEP